MIVFTMIWGRSLLTPDRELISTSWTLSVFPMFTCRSIRPLTFPQSRLSRFPSCYSSTSVAVTPRALFIIHRCQTVFTRAARQTAPPDAWEGYPICPSSLATASVIRVNKITRGTT